MVHINQVEFENFKSFGGNVKIPLEEGFTVVTGPNGSGKSIILDGILFCLGLANSRGMRAERLPDLINNSKVKEGKSSETFVSVKFNIQDWSPREDLPPLELFIRSGNLSALIPLLLARPKQNKIPSKILLFPEPLGPVTTVKPSSRGIFTLPPKDLKFSNST